MASLWINAGVSLPNFIEIAEICIFIGSEGSLISLESLSERGSRRRITGAHGEIKLQCEGFTCLCNDITIIIIFIDIGFTNCAKDQKEIQWKKQKKCLNERAIGILSRTFP